MKKRLLSLLLSVVIVLGMLPANVFAAETDGTGSTEPAADAVVYLTVSLKGVLATDSTGNAMVNKSVTVQDYNSDGVLSYSHVIAY